MIFLASLVAIAVFIFLIRATSNTSDKTNESPKTLDHKRCVFCNKKIGALDSDLYYNASMLFSGTFRPFITSFCRRHDPVKTGFTLPSTLQELLVEERKHFDERDVSRRNAHESTSTVSRMGGVALMQSSGALGVAIGVAAGAAAAWLSHRPDDFDKYFERNADIQLRVNVAIAEYALGQNAPELLKETDFEKIDANINDCRDHFQSEIQMLKEIDSSDNVLKRIYSIEKALEELESVRDRIMITRTQSSHKIDQFKAQDAEDERIASEILQVRNLKDKGLITQSECLEREYKIKNSWRKVA